MEWINGRLRISDRPDDVDLGALNAMLAGTYWAKKRPPERTEVAVRNSLNFSVLDGQEFIGFGRAITDGSVYASIVDVVIDERRRGKGVGKWLLQTMLAHPFLRDLRVILWTTDAAQFYEQCGMSVQEGFALLGTSPVWDRVARE